jgi:hypothetical protein
LILEFPINIDKDVFIIEFAYNRNAKVITNQKYDRQTIMNIHKYFEICSEKDLIAFIKANYQMIGFHPSGDFYLKEPTKPSSGKQKTD